MRTHLLVAATFGLGLSACDSSNEPTVDERFDCIGSVQAGVPTQAQVTISGVVREYVGNAPAVGVRVTMCALGDPNCAAPFGTITTAADGAVSFTVPTGSAGFDGFARFERTGMVPQLNFARPLVIAPRSYNATMVSTAAWSMFLLAAGVSDNAGRGHVALRAHDCDGNTASGVRFTLDRADASTTTKYVNATGLPLTANMTDASGRAVLLNVPTGTVTATATLVATGQRIGTLTFLVQAGFLSGLSFPPTP